MISNLNTKYVDPIRRFWIDDNLPSWSLLEGELGYEVNHNCQIDRFNIHHTDSVCQGKAIYLGDFLNIWGHCITDNLKKFWFLRTKEGKQYVEKGYKLICTLYNADKITRNFVELLSYLGIDGNNIEVVQYGTAFEELIVPQDSFDENHKAYKEFVETIDLIRSQIPFVENSPEKVYFSRSKLRNGRDYGEKNIETVFSKIGFEIIYPEQLSLEKQLVLLKNCKEFAATEGSVSHVAMFCQDSIKCYIIRKTVSLNGYQFSINSIRHFDVTYIDAHASLFQIFDNSYGPFLMYTNDNLVNFAKENGIIIKKGLPFLLLLRYLCRTVWLSIRYRIKPKLIRDPKYYVTKIIQDLVI